MSDERKPNPTPNPKSAEEVDAEAAPQTRAEVEQGKASATTIERETEEKALRDTNALRAVARSPEADREGVEALLKISEDTIEDERERGRALDTKAASLVGFSGLILSLNGAVAKPLFDADLGSYETPVKILFGIAILSLFIAVVVAIVGVLRPQRYRGFGRDELRGFATAEAQQMSRLIVHQRMLGAAADMLDTNRNLNDGKARLSKFVGYALAVGFFAVALQASAVGLSQIGADSQSEDECTRTVQVTSSRTSGSRTTTTIACPTPVPPPFGTDVTPSMGP